jgi:hypothetical protein
VYARECVVDIVKLHIICHLKCDDDLFREFSMPKTGEIECEHLDHYYYHHHREREIDR